MEIRVGDVVRLIPLTVTEVYDDGDMCFKEDVGLISPDLVEAVIGHAETDAEKIARLDARVKELEGLVDVILPDAPINRLADHDGLSKKSYDVQILDRPKAPWYPEQLEGYGPWIKGSDLPPETNVYGYMCHVRNGNEVFFCKKLDEEKPLYPDQIEGYGPWAKTVKVLAGAIVREVRTIVHNGEILFCVKLA